MFERMLDKNSPPGRQQIREYLGEESYMRLCGLCDMLAEQYDLSQELRFPFGSNYGWGYKISHKSVHLCHAFFEEGAFTITIQVGDKQVPALEKVIAEMTPKAKELWDNRYPCGENGGWIHDRILADADIADILLFIHAKKAPKH